MYCFQFPESEKWSLNSVAKGKHINKIQYGINRAHNLYHFLFKCLILVMLVYEIHYIISLFITHNHFL